MPIAPGLDGTDTSLQRMASRVALLEAPTASGTATSQNATSFAITMNAGQGIITSPALTAGVSVVLTLTNSFISTTDILWFGCQNGSNTALVQLSPGLATLANGSCTVAFNNVNTTAHNGTIQIMFELIKMVAVTSPD